MIRNALIIGICLLAGVAVGQETDSIPTHEGVLDILGSEGYPLGPEPWTVNEPSEPYSIQHAIQAGRHRAKVQTYMLLEHTKQRKALERMADAAETLATEGITVETTPPDMSPLIESVGELKHQLEAISGVEAELR